MSIAGVIEKVRTIDKGLEIELTGIHKKGEAYESPGQMFMVILIPTYRPEVGTVIWGGSGSVVLETTPKRNYIREGYTSLKEDF